MLTTIYLFSLFFKTAVTIDIDPINDPPVALDDAATTGQGIPVTVNVLDGTFGGADSDPDTGDILTPISATTPGNGGVTINPDGTIEYTPNAPFTGQDSFVYTISDGNGETASATGM